MAKYLGEGNISQIKGKVPKLYDGYGSNEDGSVTQKFIDGKLNSTTFAVGLNALADGTNSVSVGLNSNAASSSGVAIGNSSSAGGFNNVAIGKSSKTNSSYSIGIGDTATATSSSTVAIGPQSASTGTGAVSLGMSAKCDKTGSVSLGAYSTVTRVGEVGIGPSNVNYGYNGTKTRILSGLAAGELDTDAVNLKQMQDYVAENGGGGSSAGTIHYKGQSSSRLLPNNDTTIFINADIPSGLYKCDVSLIWQVGSTFEEGQPVDMNISWNGGGGTEGYYCIWGNSNGATLVNLITSVTFYVNVKWGSLQIWAKRGATPSQVGNVSVTSTDVFLTPVTEG